MSSRIRRSAKPTLTAVELNRGETLEFALFDTSVRRLRVLESAAEPLETFRREETGETGIRSYRIRCRLAIDGEEHLLEREIGTDAVFADPVVLAGMTLWLDAVDGIFAFLSETHDACRPQWNGSEILPPRREVRLAVQDATARICPEALHPWCPLPVDGPRIRDCYRGDDCWLGPYAGWDAHGGLDLNHPPGTPLWAPLAVDDQFYFNRLETGQNNNRWRALRHWSGGDVWILQAHHMRKALVPEHVPLARGTHFAEGAGVHSGAADHTHFVFKVLDGGELIPLDPWLLFRQMLLDRDEVESPPGAWFERGSEDVSAVNG